MQINSLEFLIFLAIVVILYKIIPKKYKWIVLLVASYVFYFINSAKLTIFIILSTVSIYFVGKKIQKIEMQYKDKIKNIVDKNEKKLLKEKSKKIKRRYLAIGVLINIIILVILKYSGFIIQNVNSLFYIVHINIKFPIYKFILPLGISYYTLQAISYLVDVYRQKIDADQNIGRLALFLAFFPQMVEGPIGRYDKWRIRLLFGLKELLL
jgi:alginate O-acetyltransferase complex protein AlgI